MKMVLSGVLQKISRATCTPEMVTIYKCHFNVTCACFKIWLIGIHVKMIPKMTCYCAAFATLTLMPCGGENLERLVPHFVQRNKW
jgi:hypothetical protein